MEQINTLQEAAGIISTDDIAKAILKVLRKNGIEAGSEQEAAIMAKIMVLIARRDDKLTHYAYGLGKGSR